MGDTCAGGGRGGNGDNITGRGKNASQCAHCNGGLQPKQLIGIPWRVAFALQADGWWLRSDIVWYKPNAMPESVTDRPTKAHEYVFLLAKQERYYYDAEAIKEPAKGWNGSRFEDGKNLVMHPNVGKQRKPAGWDTGPGTHGNYHRDGRAQQVEYTETTAETRNRRTVWTIPTTPFSAWSQIAHWERVELDAVCGGMMRKPSVDCPVHGCLDRPRGGREADDLSRTVRNDTQLVLMQAGADDANSNSYESSHLASSLSSERQECDPSAIDRSTQSRRTDRVPETNLPCTPCAEIGDRTQSTSIEPASFGQDRGNGGSSKAEGESGESRDSRTHDRIADTEREPGSFVAWDGSSLDGCTCTFYHRVTRKTSHFATFPPDLAQPCVLAGSAPGGIVLDPFCGSGTVGQVCLETGRRFVGLDLSMHYLRDFALPRAEGKQTRASIAAMPLFQEVPFDDAERA
jgi:hypothetical protein